MKYDVVISTLLAFAASAVMCHFLIPFLRKLKFGQQVREDGPQAHLKKQGTPTMGGMAFIPAIVIGCLPFLSRYPRLLPILFTTVGFAVIGFLDDYMKIVKKQSEGLKPLQKLIGQLVITGIFVFYMMTSANADPAMIIPFTGGLEVTFPWFVYIPLAVFIMLGTDNGVNFTDGVDGLCSSVTIVVAVYLTVVSVMQNGGIAPAAGALGGALAGFLLFNAHPAKVFMGDTGSLALGGFVVAAAFLLKIPFYIPLFGFIYLIEVISVILQVAYFKKTGGKRLFRMAPIHHHFELGGWSETQVVTIFSIVTAALCLAAYLL